MDVDTSPMKRCSSAPVIPNTAIRPTTSHNPGSASHSPALANEGTVTATPGALSCVTPPAPNIFSRTRRYSSGSFSPLAVNTSAVPAATGNQHTYLAGGVGSPSPATTSTGPRLTPRVSQLRKEECADNLNTREVSHERGLHNQLQISQSWEDLTIVTENWSCRDELSANSLPNCSSPSPTSSRPHHLVTQQPLANYGGIRYPFSMSPSPTRKAFATRRSMSPNHVRPSQLCPVKRKFDMDDSCGAGSPPPHKKMFLDAVARGSSPIHLLPLCSSPDSGTYEGRTTPKLFISKLCSSNSLSSFSSASASPTSQLEGMNEGDRALRNNNHLMRTSCALGDTPTTDSEAEGGAAEGQVKAKKDVKEGERELGDHPMLDVSARGLGNCDRTGDSELVKNKAVDKGVPGEDEDDGIGEEVTCAPKKLNQDPGFVI